MLDVARCTSCFMHKDEHLDMRIHLNLPRTRRFRLHTTDLQRQLPFTCQIYAYQQHLVSLET